MTTEIGGGRATQRNLERTIELGTMPAARPRGEHEDPFSDEAAVVKEEEEQPPTKGKPMASTGWGGDDERDGNGDERSRRAISVRTMSSATSNARPQQVRSMLDI